MKEQIKARIQELQSFIEQSAVNHHALTGRLAEAHNLLSNLEVKEKAEKDAVELTDLIDGVVHPE